MIGSTSSKRTKPITGAPSSEISPAAEVIVNNVDLLTEILLRLPAKSLFRFKSASKHWFSLISNSQFSITHTRRNPNPSILYFSCMPLEHPIPSRIAHTCNGLLLIEYARTKHYMVLNPITKKYALIPDPTVCPYGCNPRRICAYLDFDPSKSPHYKVVLLGSSYGYPGYNVGIDVYCSGSTSWKQIRAPGNKLINAAFSGGAFYWFSDENMLVGFDVDSEKMIEMPNAPTIQGSGMIRYLVGCGGRLIVILTYNLKILEMDKNDGSWMIGCEIDLNIMSANLQTKLYWGNNNFSVLSVVKKEEGKGYELVFAFPGTVSPGKVISFNLWYNTQFKLWTSVRHEVVPGESILDTPPYATAYAHIESLYPI